MSRVPVTAWRVRVSALLPQGPVSQEPASQPLVLASNLPVSASGLVSCLRS
ncbi:MAG: hypothetical protein O3A87_02680 [Verrucomicrobia bacterium]|nr:hypothetical protein [Verrucomicrobiota bacterium]MDA1005373.1 hypothetical protein [Verrucomicrobiota bacterium]